MTSFAGWLDEALDVTQGTSEFEPKKKYTIEDYQKIIILKVSSSRIFRLYSISAPFSFPKIYIWGSVIEKYCMYLYQSWTACK
jgi:hypothetical protein